MSKIVSLPFDKNCRHVLPSKGHEFIPHVTNHENVKSFLSIIKRGEKPWSITSPTGETLNYHVLNGNSIQTNSLKGYIVILRSTTKQFCDIFLNLPPVKVSSKEVGRDTTDMTKETIYEMIQDQDRERREKVVSDLNCSSHKKKGKKNKTHKGTKTNPIEL